MLTSDPLWVSNNWTHTVVRVDILITETGPFLGL